MPRRGRALPAEPRPRRRRGLGRATTRSSSSPSARPRSRRPLLPGVDLARPEAARKPDNPADVVSWDLPEAIADADLVHIHQAYTRCSEMGLLVAKQQRKPICVTDHGGNSSPLGIELGSLELADRIFCQSDFGASLLRTRTPIVMVKGGVDATLFAPPGRPPGARPRPLRRPAAAAQGDRPPDRGPPARTAADRLRPALSRPIFPAPPIARRGQARSSSSPTPTTRRSATSTPAPGPTCCPRSIATATATPTSPPS